MIERTHYVPLWERPILKPSEAAQLCGVHVNTIYIWKQRHDLPTFTIYQGGDYYIRRADLDRWLEERGD